MNREFYRELRRIISEAKGAERARALARPGFSALEPTVAPSDYDRPRGDEPNSINEIVGPTH
jgi:hypothetical protein